MLQRRRQILVYEVPSGDKSYDKEIGKELSKIIVKNKLGEEKREYKSITSRLHFCFRADFHLVDIYIWGILPLANQTLYNPICEWVLIAS